MVILTINIQCVSWNKHYIHEDFMAFKLVEIFLNVFLDGAFDILGSVRQRFHPPWVRH